MSDTKPAVVFVHAPNLVIEWASAGCEQDERFVDLIADVAMTLLDAHDPAASATLLPPTHADEPGQHPAPSA